MERSGGPKVLNEGGPFDQNVLIKLNFQMFNMQKALIHVYATCKKFVKNCSTAIMYTNISHVLIVFKNMDLPVT